MLRTFQMALVNNFEMKKGVKSLGIFSIKSLDIFSRLIILTLKVPRKQTTQLPLQNLKRK